MSTEDPSTADADPFEHEDAAYVLGALGHEDRLAFEEHLRGCARCSAAVAELAALPGLLSRLPAMPAGPEEAEAPPDTVLPGLLARVRRDRVRRRAWTAAAGVAAAAVLVAGTALVTAQTTGEATGQPTGPADPGGVPVVLSEVGDVPVEAQLRLEDVAWGTRITMTCRYDGPAAAVPYDPRATYSLVVVPTDGSDAQRVAQWQALPGRDARVAGSTALPVDEIGEVRLLDGTGTVLLEGTPP